MTEYISGEELRAIGIILLLVWGLSEPLKRLYRHATDDYGSFAPRVIAMGIGTLFGQLVWPVTNQFDGWVVGLALGSTALTIHAVLVFLVDKWKPGLGDKMTGQEDVRKAIK